MVIVNLGYLVKNIRIMICFKNNISSILSDTNELIALFTISKMFSAELLSLSKGKTKYVPLAYFGCRPLSPGELSLALRDNMSRRF